MIRRRQGMCLPCIIILLELSMIACREYEPPQSNYRDLGSDGLVLLPTSSTRMDPAIKDGTAQWQPFREPNLEAMIQGNRHDEAARAEAITGGREIEIELRELLDEYNSLVTEGKYEELPDFFVEEQSDAVERLTKTLPPLIESIKGLNEVLPESSARVEKLLTALALKAVLKMEVDTIKAVSASEAVGRLRPGSIPFALSSAVPATDRPIEFRFVVGDDDYWYIDLPALGTLAPVLSVMNQRAGELNELIEGIQSGQIPGDAIAGRIDLIAQTLDQIRQGETGAQQPGGDETGEDRPKVKDTRADPKGSKTDDAGD